MRRRQPKGQILPLAVFLLLPLSLFVGVNGERLLMAIGKSERQRQADSLVMLAAAEQARALNAIAALNEALGTAVNRAYLFGGAVTALYAACSAFLFPPPPCWKPMGRAALETPKFFRKLKNLGEGIAQAQDQIKAWAERSPARAVLRFNLARLVESEGKPAKLAGLPWAFLYPEQERARAPGRGVALPIRRADEKTWSHFGAQPGASAVAEGGDVVACDPEGYKPALSSAEAALAWEERKRPKRFPRDRIKILYRGPNGRTAEITEERVERTKRRGDQIWTFHRVDVLTCRSLKEAFDLPSFGLPKPYVLKETDRRLTVTLLTLPDSSAFSDFIPTRTRPYETPHPDNPLGRWRPALWTLSEARVSGADLNEMDFEPILSDLTQREEALETIRRKPFFRGLDSIAARVASAPALGSNPKVATLLGLLPPLERDLADGGTK